LEGLLIKTHNCGLNRRNLLEIWNTRDQTWQWEIPFSAYDHDLEDDGLSA